MSQCWTERLTFLTLNHLNMQLWAVTPGINWAIFYQSSWVRSFSKSIMQCRSAYLETVQAKILRSYSLQFFLILRFLSILSIREDTMRMMVSSLIELGITFFPLFNWAQWATTSSLRSLFLCKCRVWINLVSLFLAYVRVSLDIGVYWANASPASSTISWDS